MLDSSKKTMNSDRKYKTLKIKRNDYFEILSFTNYSVFKNILLYCQQVCEVQLRDYISSELLL